MYENPIGAKINDIVESVCKNIEDDEEKKEIKNGCK